MAHFALRAFEAAEQEHTINIIIADNNDRYSDESLHKYMIVYESR